VRQVYLTNAIEYGYKKKEERKKCEIDAALGRAIHLNDLVYRIQQGRHGKPKVVHWNRLWVYCGDQAELCNEETSS
jgi:hypothetical protein